MSRRVFKPREDAFVMGLAANGGAEKIENGIKLDEPISPKVRNDG